MGLFRREAETISGSILKIKMLMNSLSRYRLKYGIILLEIIGVDEEALGETGYSKYNSSRGSFYGSADYHLSQLAGVWDSAVSDLVGGCNLAVNSAK